MNKLCIHVDLKSRRDIGNDHLFCRIAIFFVQLSSSELWRQNDTWTAEVDTWHLTTRNLEFDCTYEQIRRCTFETRIQKLKQRHNKPCKQCIIPQNYSSKAQSLPQWLVAIMFILITRLGSREQRLVDFFVNKGRATLMQPPFITWQNHGGLDGGTQATFAGHRTFSKC